MHTVSTEMANLAVAVLKDKRARDIRLLDIAEITTLADYFIIATGTSTTHVQSLADEIVYKLTEAGHKLHHKEGFRNGRWILVDYGNIVVHVFHDEERKYYNLEKIWVDAKSIPVDNEDDMLL